MKKGKIFKTLAVAGACLCAPLVLSGCMKENSSKVDFRVKDGYIQVTEDGKNWKNLIDIDDLKGEQGLPGENGVGIDGKEVEFQVTDGWIQWKYTIDTEWTDLIQLEELKGEDGEDAVAPTITIGGNGNWVINGEDIGVKAEAVNGETGNGIQNVTIDPNKSDASKTTYVITFTDNTTFEFEVQNGQDGENAEAEEYTITYDYGVASEFFQTAPTSETIKSTQWLTTLPSIKSDYIECFKGWFIQGTDKQIENYDFIGGNVTLEARFYVNESSPAGLYKNGKMTETWQQLIDSEYITVDGTTITGSSEYYIRGELVINNSINTIGEEVFIYCEGLTSIEIPSSVTTIEDYAFYDCEGLTSIEIPSSVTSIGYNAFSHCSGLERIVVEEGNHVYDSRENCNAIIETAVECLMLGCKNTIIPNGVTTIEDYAFYQCEGLTSIEIPSSVTSIGDSAFSGCTGLTSITVDSGNDVYRSEGNCIIRKSDNTLIAGCKTSVIPNSVTSIGDGAFAYCTGLTSIEIPSSVTSIGSYAFYQCEGLTSIEIPNSVTTIGICVFYRCTGLTSIEIPNRITIIESSAFAYCTGLTEIEIPSSVTTIAHCAFEGCTGLTEIEIPSSVTSIGSYAFMGCTGLESITVDSGNSVYRSEGNCIIRKSDNMLILGCKTSVIPSSVTSIGEIAFSGCIGLTTITIPGSVTSIGYDAFYKCTGLTEITIPSSVTTIEYGALAYCTNLKTVVIDSATIANSLTGVDLDNNGALLSNATTIYIKSGLDVSGSTYLASHFTKQSTSDMVDYDKYVLNEN